MNPKTTPQIAVGLILIGLAVVAQAAPELQPTDTFSGLTGVVWHADLSGLNDALEQAGYPDLSDFAFLYGQRTTIDLSDDLRVGVCLLTGETTTSGVRRTARLGLTLGAGSVEWRPGGGLTAVGLAVGGGTSAISLVDHRPESFEDALANPFRTEIDRWLYTVTPFVSADGAPCDGVTLRLRAGYLFTIGCAWRAEGVTLPHDMRPFGGPMLEATVAIDLNLLISGLIGDVGARSTE